MDLDVHQISNTSIRYLRKKLMNWGENNYADFPWRYKVNKFHALVAELLLQRTKAEQVIPVYKRFTERFPDPLAVSDASLKEMEDIIAPLGLKWRAKFLLALGKRLNEMNSRIPDNLSELQKLPGVGPYSAAAYLSFHEGKREIILDSNIVRFFGRFFGFNTGPETRRSKKIRELVGYITPKRRCRVFNYSLIDFTRKVCTLMPNHEVCLLRKRCVFYLTLTCPK